MLNIKNMALAVSAVTAGYLLYIRHCYKYLASLGYDGPPPKFFLGNLADFASAENSTIQANTNTTEREANSVANSVVQHYSKTLRRWSRQYGKIYGFYEGHSPVLVLADPDLVAEVFLNQSKLLAYRRSFPMSKSSTDPDADIFVSNGLRWMRVRYGLEKVMLNIKNAVRCLDYADKAFSNTFLKQQDLNKLQENFNIQNRIKLFMVQTMFNVIFGNDLESFLTQMPFDSTKKPKMRPSSLYYTQIVSHKFHKAFAEYESFSLLKFAAMTISECSFVWRNIDRFKRVFNTHVFQFAYFADPMDWFFINFIQKHLRAYSGETQLHADRMQSPPFGYLNSFLYLTYNSIFKDTQTDGLRKQTYQSRQRALTVSGYKALSSVSEEPKTKFKFRNFSIRESESIASSSLRVKSKSSAAAAAENSFDFRKSFLSIRDLVKEDLKEYDLEEYESWKLTVNEALSNSLLMFFAGYETTSSALGFCCHVLTKLPEQRDKLLDEIKDYWTELSYNLDSSVKKPNASQGLDEEDSTSSAAEDTSFDDDVFETDSDKENDKQQRDAKATLEQWNEMYNTLDKMKYLDMFVREVLRMFPIANSMVSRKCMVDDLYIDNGNYFIPKGMNVVVDVLSIHFDPVIWGPVDPEEFYPERFLSERNPAAYLSFGIGSRKCLGIKLAMSQIKLFIVRLLQNYTLNNSNLKEFHPSYKAAASSKEKLAESIETKDVLFNGPCNNIQISINKRYQPHRDGNNTSDPENNY